MCARCFRNPAVRRASCPNSVPRLLGNFFSPLPAPPCSPTSFPASLTLPISARKSLDCLISGLKKTLPPCWRAGSSSSASFPSSPPKNLLRQSPITPTDILCPIIFSRIVPCHHVPRAAAPELSPVLRSGFALCGRLFTRTLLSASVSEGVPCTLWFNRGIILARCAPPATVTRCLCPTLACAASSVLSTPHLANLRLASRI